ncbi:hypothetical protein DMN91_005395 [Ooceraea biroi]|uniref:Myb/SANT-like DNA-binding domain-containing protein n=1 Tax=Ooceraea biroi TaxID=2015173 RepID=A0A026VY83_OOCBI|nr:uncharacterized protein LOC105285187 [Ooceraea biroi]XP_011347513.1 uncharacterized protein LOC105285187 [Ooceraea biroi]EZA48768.1 hypothetical protein X777_12684 [Ooceraea biroi]RLU23117.1 hypothetical protein DMN91_005395 [Ooceraea biroi]
MSESSGDNAKYKWTPESTTLLVSVWSDRQVQKQLEYASRPLIIWENVARYMMKKGYNVTGKQCRSRMKQVLVCYREAKRAGTNAGIEQYYETVDRVLRHKRLEHVNINGIDTVDATANYIKSPAKDLKTNKNLQMRLKVQEPVQSLFRTEALSPTWVTGRENEYPDSPESNETIIAKPYRVLSPTRDVAINTNEHMIQFDNRAIQTNPVMMEKPIRENYHKDILASYPYGEIPYQNTVQNVQNQIIQENMQQYQSTQQQNQMAWNQLPQQQNVPTSNRFGYQRNVHVLNQQLLPNGVTQVRNVVQNPNMADIVRQQNQLQQSAPYADNRAMPQEPRKIAFGQNTIMTYKQYGDTVVPRLSCVTDKQSGSLSPDYSPDVSQNLNNAFCQPKSGEMKTHSLNETFSQPANLNNAMPMSNPDTTVLTNNATCNDDSMLLEFLLDSPTPSENGGKLRDNAVNTDTETPSAPFRKKKAQKLEQLMLNAINSQNEVVNKILAAQSDMVTRFLDVDRDRQNRLENRLDHLLNVVHASVLNKNESSPPPPPMPEPTITCLLPPPKPGMVPPKLDLVPPKPCRVPCTMPNSNVELINQNPVLTRPGIVSPIIASPVGRKLGTIWSKLGPVSTSPFVKAQQRLGFQPVFNNDARTQSSAERRIAKEVGEIHMNTRSLIYETVKLLEMERAIEERVENARLETSIGQVLAARNRLFTQREPTPIMILTAAFLDAECGACEKDPPYYGTWDSRKRALKCAQQDKLLTGQGESYERMRHLNAAVQRGYLGCEPCDTSTPAKFPLNNLGGNVDEAAGVPKQTIQQLARLVMNSARWRESASHNQQHNVIRPAAVATQPANQDVEVQFNATYTAPKANAPPEKPQRLMAEQKRGCDVAASDGKPLENNPQGAKFPMGFTTTMLTVDQKGVTLPRQASGRVARSLGFVEDNPLIDRKNNVRFMDDALAELQRMYIERQTAAVAGNDGVISAQSRNMIERYVSELTKKPARDKDTDSDNDDEYLDTTASVHPPVRKGSLTSNGTASTETAHSVKSGKGGINNCRIS